MSSRPPDLFFDYISAEDVKSAHDIEVAGASSFFALP